MDFIVKNAYNKRDIVKEHEMESIMHVEIDGMKLNYKEQGEGKTVVLLHGWGGCADSFLPVFNHLTATHKVYALDFPGFGLSDPPTAPWDVTDYTEMLRKFFERMNIEKATLIGHSFGGRVSILFSSTYPERVEKVVLADSAGIIPKRGWKYHFKVYQFKLAKKIFLTFSAKGTQEERLEAFYRKHGSADYKQAGSAMRQTFVKVVNQDLRSCLPRIKAPALLVWGDEDKDTPLYFGQIMEKEIPDAGLVVFKGAGHFAYLDRINDFNIIVSKFLEG